MALLALEGLLGLWVCRFYLVPAAPDGRHDDVERRLRWGFYLGAGLLSLAIPALLAITAQGMSGAPWPELWPAIKTVLAATYYGHLWWLQVACILAMWLWACQPQRRRHTRASLLAMLVFLAVIAFVHSATGHAGDSGLDSLHFWSDWLHILFTSLWAGSVIAAAGVIFAGRKRACPPNEVLAQQGLRLSRLATLALAGVLLTGLYNSWCSFATPWQLVTTRYGGLLVFKLGLVAGMVVLGGINRFRHLSSLALPEQARRFTVILTCEAGLAIGILLVVGALINTAPPWGGAVC